MTALTRLNLKNIRIINELQLCQLAPVNYFYGPNGGGKTTILEALYLLSTGRSFRTALGSRLIKYDEEELLVFAGFVTTQPVVEQLRVGLSKSAAGKTSVRINERSSANVRELALLLPMQLIHPESYELLTAGPQSRRHFLDWGVFHVKPEFSAAWARFQRVLKQRNAALWAGASRDEVCVWDTEFIELGQHIDAWRRDYVTAFNPLLNQLLTVTRFPYPLELIYNPGWGPHVAAGAEQAALTAAYARDYAVRHTSIGPHRADLAFKVNGFAAHEVLSRGQQKFLIYLLKIAQAQFLQLISGEQCLFLIDDFAAELDHERRQKLLETLLSLGNQLILTGLEPILYDFKQAGGQSEQLAVFHVEHGAVLV